MKLWFRTEGKPYEGNEPNFFEANNFDWAEIITSNYHIIKDEISPLINEETNLLKPYLEKEIQFPPENWKTESFYFWSRANRKMINLFPKTNEILKKIPGLVSASINLLEPGSKINAHYGDTNAIYRCHLGLKVPEGLPKCGFRVNNETRAWEEGKLLIFLDAYTHDAFNYSNNKRFIMLFDVLRPEFRNKKNYVCSHVLGATAIYEYTNNISLNLRKAFENAPGPLQSLLIIFTQIYAYLFFTLQRIVFKTKLN
jgi:aspartyl/asparaginyl beta-hydroxylase (cupin superfamily)